MSVASYSLVDKSPTKTGFFSKKTFQVTSAPILDHRIGNWFSMWVTAMGWQRFAGSLYCPVGQVSFVKKT